MKDRPGADRPSARRQAAAVCPMVAQRVRGLPRSQAGAVIVLSAERELPREGRLRGANPEPGTARP